MKTYYVYKHTFPNGKVYIGITSQKPERRWNKGKGYRRKHKGKWGQPLMARATLKYDWDDIKHEVLCEGLSKEDAEAKEIELIAFYRSNEREFGYNISEGGGATAGMTGKKHSEETKKKISETHKGKFCGEDNPFFGKAHSEESKRKMSEAAKGKKLSEETKKKIGKASREREREPFSEEAKKKISEGLVRSVGKSVVCIDTGVVYRSVSDASRDTGAIAANISAVCKGRRRVAGGLKWAYYEEKVS